MRGKSAHTRELLLSVLTRLPLACTAVVTEIAHHPKKTIEGDVSFLSEAEWRAELSVLLDDLVDEDGNLKRSTDLRSDAGVAWQKVYCYDIDCVYAGS